MFIIVGSHIKECTEIVQLVISNFNKPLQIVDNFCGVKPEATRLFSNLNGVEAPMKLACGTTLEFHY